MQWDVHMLDVCRYVFNMYVVTSTINIQTTNTYHANPATIRAIDPGAW